MKGKNTAVEPDQDWAINQMVRDYMMKKMEKSRKMDEMRKKMKMMMHSMMKDMDM